MNERIRQLRESIGLSRAAFGEKLGVSGDVINNLERGRVEIKEPIIKLICKEFNISYLWLTQGVGSMEEQTEFSAMARIDAIMTGENETAKRIFKAFAKLDEKEWELYESRRRAIMNYNTGMKNSKMQGIEEGIEIGRADGLAKGEIQAKRETAKNLLDLGVEVDKIIKATGLSKEEKTSTAASLKTSLINSINTATKSNPDKELLDIINSMETLASD